MEEDKKIKQAVVLSAGLGTRLKEVTGDLPKVMAPILGKPILQWHIERLRDHGIYEIFINLHYGADTIRDYFGDGSRFGVHITYVHENPQILGTAGGVKGFENKLDEHFFVLYGDIFNLVDYTKMGQYYFDRRSLEPAGILGVGAVGDTDHPHDSDLAEVDPTLLFHKIHKKPHQSLPEVYKSMRGIYVFNKKILEYIPKDMYYELDHDALTDAIQKGEKFFGYETDEYIKDIGTPERYKKVHEDLKELNFPGSSF